MRRLIFRAPLTARLCVALLVSGLFGMLLPGYVEALSLAPCRVGIWNAFPSFLLHSLVMGSPVHWLITALSLFFSALVCERVLGGIQIVFLWVGATLFGAAAYLVTTDDCTPFIGPAAFAWGFAGAALVVVVFRWKQSHWLAKAYFMVILANLATLLQVPASVAALQSTGLLFGIFLALLLYRLGRINAYRPNPSFNGTPDGAR